MMINRMEKSVSLNEILDSFLESQEQSNQGDDLEKDHQLIGVNDRFKEIWRALLEGQKQFSFAGGAKEDISEFEKLAWNSSLSYPEREELEAKLIKSPLKLFLYFSLRKELRRIKEAEANVSDEEFSAFLAEVEKYKEENTAPQKQTVSTFRYEVSDVKETKDRDSGFFASPISEPKENMAQTFKKIEKKEHQLFSFSLSFGIALICSVGWFLTTLSFHFERGSLKNESSNRSFLIAALENSLQRSKETINNLSKEIRKSQKNLVDQRQKSYMSQRLLLEISKSQRQKSDQIAAMENNLQHLKDIINNLRRSDQLLKQHLGHLHLQKEKSKELLTKARIKNAKTFFNFNDLENAESDALKILESFDASPDQQCVPFVGWRKELCVEVQDLLLAISFFKKEKIFDRTMKDLPERSKEYLKKASKELRPFMALNDLTYANSTENKKECETIGFLEKLSSLQKAYPFLQFFEKRIAEEKENCTKDTKDRSSYTEGEKIAESFLRWFVYSKSKFFRITKTPNEDSLKKSLKQLRLTRYNEFLKRINMNR